MKKVKFVEEHFGGRTFRWYFCPACGKNLLRDPTLVRATRAFCAKTGRHVVLRLLPEGTSESFEHHSSKKGRRKTTPKKSSRQT